MNFNPILLIAVAFLGVMLYRRYTLKEAKKETPDGECPPHKWTTKDGQYYCSVCKLTLSSKTS